MYAIKVDGEEIDHAETLAAARRARDTIIYGGIGTEANTTIERKPSADDRRPGDDDRPCPCGRAHTIAEHNYDPDKEED